MLQDIYLETKKEKKEMRVMTINFKIFLWKQTLPNNLKY